MRLGFSGRSPSVSILPPDQDPRDKAEPKERRNLRLGDDFEFEVCLSPLYWEPNFKFEIIPEPHVSAFLGLGLVAWVLVRRKNGNRTGSPAESQSHSASPDEPGANP